MRKYLLVAAACLALGAAALPAPVEAQDTGGKAARGQKMKDCAAKWKEEKAQKNVSGRAAYRAYMKECLKG